MNKIYEFAAKAALEDYVNQDVDDCIGYEVVKETLKGFNDYLKSLDVADDTKNELDDKVSFLLTKYEDCAFINGFYMAAQLIYGSKN